MRFIIEFDGPLFEVAAVHFFTHRAVAAEVGWSSLDEATFRRLIRTKGRDADVLSGATAAKVAEYNRCFAKQVESDSTVAKCRPQAAVREAMSALALQGSCCCVTLGSNLSARRGLLDQYGIRGLFEGVEQVDPDPRRRPGQLQVLAAGDKRAIVVAATDSLIRAAGGAELFCVGLACGLCGLTRLYQAGPSVVCKTLGDLVSSLETGATDLIRAGLLPPPLG